MARISVVQQRRWADANITPLSFVTQKNIYITLQLLLRSGSLHQIWINGICYYHVNVFCHVALVAFIHLLNNCSGMRSRLTLIVLFTQSHVKIFLTVFYTWAWWFQVWHCMLVTWQAFGVLTSNVLRVIAINSVGTFVLFLGKVGVMAATCSIAIVWLRVSFPVVIECRLSYWLCLQRNKVLSSCQGERSLCSLSWNCSGIKCRSSAHCSWLLAGQYRFAGCAPQPVT